MEQQILELLKSENKAFSVYEINDALCLKTASELKDLLKLLHKMEEELKVYRTKKDNYMLFQNSHLKVGKLFGNKKGFGFVDIEGDEDVFIAPTNMNGAIHGDRVIVEITSPKNVDLEGRILKIVNRELKEMVGEFHYEKNQGYVASDDAKLHLKVYVPQEKAMGAMEGHKVLVRLLSPLKEQNCYRGEVLKVLGHKNDPGVDILSIVNQFHLSYEFPEAVMEQIETIPLTVSEEEMQGRKDLREQEIFTIDGDDTKDIDDAISAARLSNGNYELGVHIADVSYYVRENTPLDQEAYERGTSVYLADRVIPMLPHKLSNGICSLNPNVDRLAISCVMEINQKGEVVNYDIFESVICSKKQMTYRCVNQILEEKTIPEGYEPFVETLKLMQEISSKIRKNKVSRGYIDFDIQEAKIIVDDSGKAIDVKLRERGIGQNMIEDFMIAANETVATHIYFMELPFIYRIHGEPNELKIESFLKFIGVLGYHMPGKIKSITPKTMQDILAFLKDKREFPILSSLLLRSMQKAVYDKNNIGHFGLASKYYTHFTSPIRRYPDTTVHRLLRTYLFEHKMDHDTIRYWDHKLLLVAEQASLKEQASVACEREVDDMKKAEYMEGHIGEEYDGIISSVMSFGMFVELSNLVEGLIRIDSLKGGYYTYDETTFSLCSEKNKRGYRLGDSIRVKVIGASKEAKTVDFELIDPSKADSNR